MQKQDTASEAVREFRTQILADVKVLVATRDDRIDALEQAVTMQQSEIDELQAQVASIGRKEQS